MMERRAACAVVELPPHKEKKGPSKVWIIGGTNEQGQRLQTSEWIEVFSPEQDEDCPGMSVSNLGQPRMYQLQEDLPDAARRLSRRMSRSDAAAAAVAARAPHDDHSATDSASATAEETLTAAGSSAAGPTPDAAAEAVETAAQAAAVVLGGSADAAEGTDTAVEAETEGDPAAGDAEKQEAEPEGEDAEGEAPVEPAKVPHPNQEDETPNLRQFKNGPPMLVPRSGLAAVRLSDVVVLLAGGVGPDGGHLDSTEFFDFDDSKEIMQKGPRLSWGCDSQFGFGYCAAGRTVIEPLES
eukprot:symbB.v1.2.012577.t1/scaffold851.1/size159786/3